MRVKFTLMLLFFTCATYAQQQVTNGGFETWSSTSTPLGWTTLEDIIPPIAGVGLTVKDSLDKVEGNYSIKITSQYVPLAGDSTAGILSLGTGFFNGNNPAFYGTAFSSKPDTIFFSYKYAPVGPDSGSLQLQLHKAAGGSVNILNAYMPLPSTGGQWVNASVVLTNVYTDYSSPCDTLKLLFSSSVHQNGGTKARVGSSLNVDALRFGYATQAPPSAAAYTMGHDPLGSYNFNLYGALNTNGDTAAYSFIYSTDSTFATSSSTSTQSKINNQFDVVWATVHGLTPATTYFYYLKATTPNGTLNGAHMRFYTDTMAFLLQNIGADVYSSGYAELQGKLNGFTDSANISFEYGLTPGFGLTQASDYPTVTDSNTHYFKGVPGSLNAGSLYFYRIKAVSATDSLYSDIKAFYMGFPFTTVQALPATNLTAISATLNGNVQGFQVPIKINSEIYGPGVYHYHSALDYHDVTPSLINYSYNASGLQANSYYNVRLKVETWVGNYYSDTAFTSLSTGINELMANNNFIVYPNPARNNVTLELKQVLIQNAMVYLYAINGQLVFERKIAEGETKVAFELNGLESGLYYVKLIYDNNILNQKVTVIR